MDQHGVHRLSTKDQEFEKKLLATFRIEAEEHIRAISLRLLDLEKSSTDEERMALIETVFREAHSLKGAARAVNASEVESICQAIESAFSALKHNRLSLSPGLFDVLSSSVDMIGAIVFSTDTVGAAQTKRTTEMIQALEELLRDAMPSASVSETNVAGKPAASPPETMVELKPDAKTLQHLPQTQDLGFLETVRISSVKLNSLLLEVEELRAPKVGLGQHLADLRGVGADLAAWARQSTTIRSELRVLRETLNAQDKIRHSGNAEETRKKGRIQIERILALSEREGTGIDLLHRRLIESLGLAEQDQRALADMTASLLEDTRKLSLVPVSSLLEGFPKLLRDLARDRGKQVEILITGDGLEADRRILEGIRDPLIHLLRNCIDHGIETPVERQSKGKSATGTITISIASKDGDKVEILFSDDGSGIDLEKVRRSARATGNNGQSASLSDEDVLSLIFQSGVSTSPMITNLSGRGLGLAIAREKVERLGGRLTVESHPSAGTAFRMVLPLTLATFRGVLVRSGDRLFVIPSNSVERATRVDRYDIKTIQNRETIQHGGETVSLARLRNVLELNGVEEAHDETQKFHLLIVHAANERIALLVDEIVCEQEVLAKPFGQQLARVRNLAGATVLGIGKTVPIVNVHDLMKSAVKSVCVTASQTQPASPARKSILIAEDSITARTLLKNIVESAGYDVKTAVDGLDAYTALRAGSFDLVVSDVEMPRMSGFDLTAKVRADKQLSETPIVLVTALDSREDRERGMDVGANAYIVKSSFDHSDLLQIVRRLA